MSRQPNVLFVFGDQWRAQATGYADNAHVQTPHIDAFARESVNVRHAVANCPVCGPWRATLMTGQYPLTHGVVVNDVPITGHATYLAEAYAAAGYDTAYIGKWHIDGHGRARYIPPERRKGFDYWKVLECTHDYNHSLYYADGPEPLVWDGYDAQAQTRDAIAYLRGHDPAKPFLLMLSWGPPHAPYDTAPERYRRLYRPEDITLRPNVPPAMVAEARAWIAGYYAHCTALDDCFAELLAALAAAGLAEDTIVVFTSDHGDMLGSQGETKKQRPWDESIRVPLLVRWPAGLGPAGRVFNTPVNSPDLMPTLLGLCGIAIPDTVEGADFSAALRTGVEPPDTGALIGLPACFHQYAYYNGGRDWRGLRTSRYTYARDHEGPWLLYDNEADPYQLENMVNTPAYQTVQDTLDAELQRRLAAQGDTFRDGRELIRECGVPINELGDPMYTN